jgi:hypothetical protein
VVKKGDIILSVGCIFAAVLLLVLAFIFKADGKTAVITVDSEVFGQYKLSDEQDIVIKTEHGENMVQISNGKITVTAANCPDHYCVDHVAIDSVGETIVCLPHRVVIEIKE